MQVKDFWSQLDDSALLGQPARSFTALLLCCFLGTLLLLGRLCGLLSRLSHTSSRALRLLGLGSAMQSLSSLGNGLVESLALSLGKLQLESGRLTGAIGTLQER